MSKSKLNDRITVSFYEEIQMDNILIEALNKIAPPRMRGIKLKEWAYEFLKNNNKDLFYEIQKSLDKSTENQNKEEDLYLKRNLNKNIKQEKKDTINTIKSKLNIITK